MEMARTLKRHGMRVSRVGHGRWGHAFALFTKGESNGERVEWRREFRYRREAYERARELIATWRV